MSDEGERIEGTGNPLLSGSLRRTVLLLAWPVLCEQVLDQLVLKTALFRMGPISLRNDNANSFCHVGFPWMWSLSW